ncbi:MAG: PilZ domain-containing protein [Vulcanimicrobiota bacterium]
MINDIIQGIAKVLRTYPTEERRRHIRHVCRYAIYALERKKAREAIVIDIGPLGLRIHTVNKYYPGQKLELVFRGVPGGKLTRLPYQKLATVPNRLPCKVAWFLRQGDAYEAGLVYQVEGAELKNTWVHTVLEKTASEQGAFEERRKMVRAKAHIDAEMRNDEGISVQGLLTNISLGGALFQSKQHMNPGASVTISVRAQAKLPALRVSGDILHHQFDVVSNSSIHCVRFKDLHEQLLEQLKRYVTVLLKTQGSG